MVEVEGRNGPFGATQARKGAAAAAEAAEAAAPGEASGEEAFCDVLMMARKLSMTSSCAWRGWRAAANAGNGFPGPNPN